jgi:hypothetical protein
MADYFQIKNQSILNPPANTNLGNSTNQFNTAYIQSNLVVSNTTFTSSTLGAPKITTITYPGDDTAADTAGGQTITLTGSGFLNGASVLINGSAVGVVTVVNNTTITFTSPANNAGSYVLYVINTDGSTAIAIPGIQYSGTPNWTTAAGTLGTVYETQSFSNTVVATGDAPISYSLFSGTLPTGATLNSNGTITGTSSSTANSTTYTFTIRATDNDQQDTDRQFSLTINPDVVTWSSPANASVINSYEYVAISNTTLSATNLVGGNISYSGANLPDGITVTGNLLAGTSNTVANTNVTLTATSNTSTRSADRTTFINVQQDVVTWNSPANNNTYTSDVNSAISNVTLNATSAAGFNVSYSANTLPTGLTITGNVIAGTPTVAANSSSLITATAATTNRSATRTFNWVIQVGNDPYFNLTTLLLNGETSSNYWIQDASTNKFAVTVVGDTRPMAFSPYETVWSNLFDGTGDYLIAGTTQRWTPANSFTIEAWFYTTSLAERRTLFSKDALTSGSALGLRLAINTDGSLYVFYSTTGSNENEISSPSAGLVTLNTWNHYAFVKNGSNCTVYLNGISRLTFTASTIASPASINSTIGAIPRSGDVFWSMLGYISNLRIVDGTAVYTTTFTPPTAPLTAIANTTLLICQNNRFIDNSTNNSTLTRFGDVTVTNFGPFTETDLTTGSGYFDGTGDYLSITNNAAFKPGTGDFTIEFWGYLFNQDGGITSGGTNSLNVQIRSGAMELQLQGAAFSATHSMTGYYESWHHFAYSRTGGVTRMFINGSLVNSVSETNNYQGDGATFEIGRRSDFAQMRGYISNLRLVKGTALYTSTFTPPTSPLTAISGTGLLTLQNRFGENNNRIIDTSGINSVVTRNGNVTQGTFSPFSQTGWSNYFDGSSTLYFAGAPISTTQTNFTIEAWVYLTSDPTFGGGVGQVVVDGGGLSGGSYWGFGLNTSRNILFRWYDGASGFNCTSTSAVSLNQWAHIAVSVSSNAIKLFINGNLQSTTGTSTLTNRGGNQGNINVGRYATTDALFGYISNARIVTGAGLYSTSFTPSTTPLTTTVSSGTVAFLTAKSNRFEDNSTGNRTPVLAGSPSIQAFSPFKASDVWSANTVGGSMSFDGTGDYLTVPDNAALESFTDFTIEFWVYFNSVSGTQVVVDKGWNGATFSPYVIDMVDGTLVAYASSGSGWDVIAGASFGVLTTGQWYHIALTRSGSSIRLFRNGNIVSTVTSSTALMNSASALGIGGGPSAGVYPLNGYISNLRIIKGAAVYTANTSPPTAPVSSIANTTLLLSGTNGGIIDYTGRNNLETIGNVQLSTSVKKFGNTSLYFDGTGDYLKASTSDLGAFGTSDFTIEMWVYFNTVSGTQNLIDFRTATADVAPTLALASGSIILYVNTGTRITTSSVSATTWYHLACVRSSGVTKIYLNGTQSGSNYTDTNSYVGKANRPWIGELADGTTPLQPLNGYIDDLRITKGVARYTSNFTAPTSAFKLR